jgi:predicted nucleic acid-binding protein
VPKYVLDTNCYIDATHEREARAALEGFVGWASPFLYLSAVVAAELRTGTPTAKDRKRLERELLDPFIRRDRILTPGAQAWDALGLTLATLGSREGLESRLVSRAFAFDVLLAFSAREAGAILVSRNTKDLARIRRVFAFEFVAPYPGRPERVA